MTAVRLCWLERSWRKAKRNPRWPLPTRPARGTGARWVLGHSSMTVTSRKLAIQILLINNRFMFLFVFLAFSRKKLISFFFSFLPFFSCSLAGYGLCWSNQAVHNCSVQPSRPNSRCPSWIIMEIQSAGQPAVYCNRIWFCFHTKVQWTLQ